MPSESLGKIAAACARARQPLRGTDKIIVRADRVLTRRKVAKHFTIGIGDDHFSYARNQDSIAAEANLDGIYVLRTSARPTDLASGQVVSSYKALAQVERAVRAFNTDLDIRPIRHRTEQRVRAHVFLPHHPAASSPRSARRQPPPRGRVVSSPSRSPRKPR